MRLHSLQHVPFEDLGMIKPWAEKREMILSATRLYDHERLPDLEAFDCLVVLGGPMNIYQEDLYPWLCAEKEFIARAIERKKKVLGICLGAQLIADVLGGPVVRNDQKEIGWYPVSLTESGKKHPFFKALPETFPAIHWHGDTFRIPPGCQHLARTAACENQAFAFGNQVLGLQFHLEYSRKSLETMCRHCSDELVTGPYIQTLNEMRKDDDEYFRLENLLNALLGNVLEGQHSLHS